MAPNKEQRVGIFIDVQNLYHSSKNLFNARVNYKELIRCLTAGRKLVRSLAYVVKAEGVEGASGAPPQPAPTGREASFFEALKGAGLELRLKDIQIYAGGAKKADWDVGMAVDTVRLAPSLDVVVLVTGAGDFIPLVEYLRYGLGRQVEVASCSRSASGKLKESCARFIAIEDIPKILLKLKNTTASHGS